MIGSIVSNGGGSADMSNYYTKAQADAKFADASLSNISDDGKAVILSVATGVLSESY